MSVSAIEVLGAAYVVIALWAMKNTTKEWLSRHDASLMGYILGMIACIFWPLTLIIIFIWARIKGD